MDKLDSKILYQMDLNARISVSEIAKRVRLTKQAVGNRIRNLEKDGTIVGYAAVIDMSSLGKPLHPRLYLVLQNMTEEKIARLMEFLKRDKRVDVCSLMDGEYDLIVCLSIHNTEEAVAFLNDLRAKFGNLISEVVFNLTVSGSHLARSYLVGKTKRDEDSLSVFGRGATSEDWSRTMKLDRIDLGILKILSSNARTKSTAIASELKVSPLLVIRRIRSLEKNGVIMGYRLGLSRLRIGYKLLISLKNVTPERRKALLSYMNGNPNFTHVLEMLGSCDIEAGIETETYEGYRRIRTELRNEFSDILKRLITLSYVGAGKYTYNQ